MIDPTTTERYSDAANAIRQAIDAIAVLIDATPKDVSKVLVPIGTIIRRQTIANPIASQCHRVD